MKVEFAQRDAKDWTPVEAASEYGDCGPDVAVEVWAVRLEGPNGARLIVREVGGTLVLSMSDMLVVGADGQITIRTKP